MKDFKPQLVQAINFALAAEKLVEKIEEDEDVQNVYHTMEEL